jgi:hypothetical protein
VRVRQILTDSDVEILLAARFKRFHSLTVTPDGNYVDAVAVSDGKSVPDLWRIPLLGGAPKLVLDKVQSAPGWPPLRVYPLRESRRRPLSLLMLTDRTSAYSPHARLLWLFQRQRRELLAAESTGVGHRWSEPGRGWRFVRSRQTRKSMRACLHRRCERP